MRSPFSVLEKGGKAYLGKTSLSPVFLLSTTQSTWWTGPMASAAQYRQSHRQAALLCTRTSSRTHIPISTHQWACKPIHPTASMATQLPVLHMGSTAVASTTEGPASSSSTSHRRSFASVTSLRWQEPMAASWERQLSATRRSTSESWSVHPQTGLHYLWKSVNSNNFQLKILAKSSGAL